MYQYGYRPNLPTSEKMEGLQYFGPDYPRPKPPRQPRQAKPKTLAQIRAARRKNVREQPREVDGKFAEKPSIFTRIGRAISPRPGVNKLKKTPPRSAVNLTHTREIAKPKRKKKTSKFGRFLRRLRPGSYTRSYRKLARENRGYIPPKRRRKKAIKPPQKRSFFTRFFS